MSTPGRINTTPTLPETKYAKTKDELEGDYASVYWLLESGELQLKRIHGRLNQMRQPHTNIDQTRSIVGQLIGWGLLSSRPHPVAGKTDPFYFIVKEDSDAKD